MEQIVLKSSARLSEVKFEIFEEGDSVDIIYRSGIDTLAGTYRREEVKQLVQELAPLFGLTITKDMSNEEPYTLPEELVTKLNWELNKDHPDSDQFIWEACIEDSDTVIGSWVQESDNAIEQLWNIFQGHPYEAKESYVLVDSDYDFLRSYSITSDDPVVTAEVSMYRTNAIQFNIKEDAEAVQRLLKDCRFNIERY